MYRFVGNSPRYQAVNPSLISCFLSLHRTSWSSCAPYVEQPAHDGPTRRQTARHDELGALSSARELYIDGHVSSHVPKLPDFETLRQTTSRTTERQLYLSHHEAPPGTSAASCGGAN
jgi:hypothetical protein